MASLLSAGCAQMAQIAVGTGGGGLGGGGAAARPSTNGIHYIGEGNRVRRVGPYWGPECEKIGAPSEPIRGRNKDADPTRGKQPNLAHDPADQVFRLVCVDTIMADADEPHRNTWVLQHFRFDELQFDHFTASMMLVQCLLADSCLDAPHVVKPRHELHNAYAEQRRQEWESRPPDVWQFYQAGMMRWYAEKLNVASVQAKLATLPLPAAAQQTYLRLVERARKDVVTFTDTLTPDAKAIFVDVPRQIFERRQAEYAKSGNYVAELAALGARVKQDPSDDNVAKLVKLRQAYEASCRKDCTRGTIFAAMTRALFWAYVARGDAPAATAEAKLLDKLDPSAAQEIGDLQAKRIADASSRLGRVRNAREQGVDAETARAAGAQAPLVDFGDGRYVYVWHRDYAIHYPSLVPGKVGQMDGTVAAVVRRGNQVTVRFRDDVTSWTKGTGCRETGRIDSITRDGRIVYREHCTGSKTMTSRRKVPPVTMLASEATGVAPGDELFGFTAYGPNQEHVNGRVWIVKRGARVIRLRDLAL